MLWRVGFGRGQTDMGWGFQLCHLPSLVTCEFQTFLQVLLFFLTNSPPDLFAKLSSVKKKKKKLGIILAGNRFREIR